MHALTLFKANVAYAPPAANHLPARGHRHRVSALPPSEVSATDGLKSVDCTARRRLLPAVGTTRSTITVMALSPNTPAVTALRRLPSDAVTTLSARRR